MVLNSEKPHQIARREDVMQNEITTDPSCRIFRQAKCRASTARCSASLYVESVMLSLTLGQSFVKLNLKKRALTTTKKCECRHGDAIFSHQHLHCHLTLRGNMKQTAHYNVSKLIQNQVKRTIKRHDMFSLTKSPHFPNTLCQRK